jgi:alpha-glucosidase
MLDIFRFWLERGVDGFRLDVFNAYYKDAALRDNPLKLGLRAFDRQEHIHDMDQAEMHPLLQDLRRLLDSYPDTYSVGETYFASLPKTLSYCGSDQLHTAFSFDFTSYENSLAFALRLFPWNPRWILSKVNAREIAFQAAGVHPTTVLSNHDLPRAATRYSRGEDDRKARIAIAVLLTLRGTPFLYQGEELGMRDISLKRSDLQDPVGKKYYPFLVGRDGCRSPMQWDDGPNAGFSSGKPWLKVHPNFQRRNVRLQRADPGSTLNFTRTLITLRRQRLSLHQGDFIPLPSSRHVLLFLRKSGKQSTLVAMNFNRRRRKLSLPAGLVLGDRLFSSEISPAPNRGSPITLAPYEVCLFDILEG